jgi:hypothetical protein
LATPLRSHDAADLAKQYPAPQSILSHPRFRVVPEEDACCPPRWYCPDTDSHNKCLTLRLASSTFCVIVYLGVVDHNPTRGPHYSKARPWTVIFCAESAIALFLSTMLELQGRASRFGSHPSSQLHGFSIVVSRQQMARRMPSRTIIRGAENMCKRHLHEVREMSLRLGELCGDAHAWLRLGVDSPTLCTACFEFSILWDSTSVDRRGHESSRYALTTTDQPKHHYQVWRRPGSWRCGRIRPLDLGLRWPLSQRLSKTRVVIWRP